MGLHHRITGTWWQVMPFSGKPWILQKPDKLTTFNWPLNSSINFCVWRHKIKLFALWDINSGSFTQLIYRNEWTSGLFRTWQSGSEVQGIDQNTSVTDKWMCILTRYAYKRCNCCRRSRAEAASTYSLARCPILYNPREGCPGVVRNINVASVIYSSG